MKLFLSAAPAFLLIATVAAYAQPAGPDVIGRYKELMGRISSGKVTPQELMELQSLSREMSNPTSRSRVEARPSPKITEKQKSAICPSPMALSTVEVPSEASYAAIRKNLRSKLRSRLRNGAGTVEAMAKRNNGQIVLAIVSTTVRRQGSATAYLLVELLDRKPNDPRLIASLASVLEDINEQQMASQLLLYAAKLAPKDPFVVNNTGWLQFHAGNFSAARATFLRNVTGEDGFTPSVEGLGWSHFCEGNLTEARKFLVSARSKQKSTATDRILGSAGPAQGESREPPVGRLFPGPMFVSGRSNAAARGTRDGRSRESPSQSANSPSIAVESGVTIERAVPLRVPEREFVFPRYPMGRNLQTYVDLIPLQQFQIDMTLMWQELARDTVATNTTLERTRAPRSPSWSANRVVIEMPDRYLMALVLLNEWFNSEYTKIVAESFDQYDLALERRKASHFQNTCKEADQRKCCGPERERAETTYRDTRFFVDKFWGRIEPLMGRYWARTEAALVMVKDAELRRFYINARELQLMRPYREIEARDQPFRQLGFIHVQYCKGADEAAPPAPDSPRPQNPFQRLREQPVDDCASLADVSVGIERGPIEAGYKVTCDGVEVNFGVELGSWFEAGSRIVSDHDARNVTLFFGQGKVDVGRGPVSLEAELGPFIRFEDAQVVDAGMRIAHDLSLKVDLKDTVVDAEAPLVGLEVKVETKGKASQETTIGIASGLKTTGKVSFEAEAQVGTVKYGTESSKEVFDFAVPSPLKK